MTKSQFGEVTWGDTSTDINPRSDSRDTFLRLEKGSNKVRIITSPFQYTVHRYKRESDPGFGQKVMCSAVHGSCPLCNLGDKPKRRWLLGVVDRKTSSFKILDIGIAVFKSIQELTRSDDWGEPNKYDIDIKVDPNGGATNYYHVTPNLPKPLSAADVQIKDMVDMDEMKRRCNPPTADKVQERLDKLFADPAAPKQVVGRPVQKAAQAPKAAPVVASNDDDDDDKIEFPNYEAK